MTVPATPLALVLMVRTFMIPTDQKHSVQEHAMPYSTVQSCMQSTAGQTAMLFLVAGVTP
jgi:hypothetical protein